MLKDEKNKLWLSSFVNSCTVMVVQLRSRGIPRDAVACTSLINSAYDAWKCRTRLRYPACRQVQSQYQRAYKDDATFINSAWSVILSTIFLYSLSASSVNCRQSCFWIQKIIRTITQLKMCMSIQKTSIIKVSQEKSPKHLSWSSTRKTMKNVAYNELREFISF